MKQTSDAAALRARSASMTYSFAQQMPAPPSRSSQPTPRPVSNDPNFPHLSNSSLSSTQHTRPPTSGKPATAAEVVAARKPNTVKNEEENDRNAKQQAELAFYSKLVPTTSAVPRNPGRPLGGGGLRATGSVVAQKPRVGASPVQVSLAQRKEPLTSRMRNLSSEASRPQLARKVAKPSRNLSATPLPSDKSTSVANGTSNKEQTKDSTAVTQSNSTDVTLKTDPDLQLEMTTPIAAPRPREVRTDSRDAYLKSIVSIYGNVDPDPSRLSARSESTSARRRLNGDVRQASTGSATQSRPKISAPQARRLEEAFTSAGRYEGVRSPSPLPTRKSQIGVLRRSSAVSPPPVHPSRKTSGRDQQLSKEMNGLKISVQEAASDAPPGFEGRASTASRASFAPRKLESDGSTNSKPVNRDVAPALPQNDRADAFREAINTRRHSSSPRPASFRRVSKGESYYEAGQQLSGNRPSEKDGSRQHANVKGHSRSGSSTQNFAGATVSSEQVVRNKRKSDQGSSRTKRDEKIFERRMERPSVSDAISHGEPISKASQSADTEKVSQEGILLRSNDRVTRMDSLEGVNGKDSRVNANHLSRISTTNHDFGLGAEVDSLAKTQPDGSVGKLNGEGSGDVTVTSDFERRDPNGWNHEPNGEHCDNGEDLVNGLLDQEEDEFVPPISDPMGTRPVGTSSMTETSMTDLMRQWPVASLPSVLNNERCEDVVLPPLPNSEDVGFESLLRSMGWTPPEEDERTRGDGMGLIRETTSRALQAGVAEIGLNSGIRGVKNSNVQNPYYSHFQ